EWRVKSWCVTNGTVTAGQTSQTVTSTACTTDTVGLTLTVTNTSNCSASTTSKITVTANPASPSIAATPAQVCASSTGNTAKGPDGASSYSWSITNGTITAGQAAQTVTYTAGATGTVGLTLTVTNASNCSRSEERRVGTEG